MVLFPRDKTRPPMEIAFYLMILALLVLNGYASRRCVNDPLISRGQRIAQLVIVWVVPILGPLAVIALSRNEHEASEGKYGEKGGLDDQYVAGLGRLNDRGYIRSPDEYIHPMEGGRADSD
jgi:hypothetical protein